MTPERYVQENLRLPGIYDTAAVGDESGIDTGDVSPVQQHLRDEVDVNTIVRRFGVTGELPFGSVAGVFGDFTDITDYESALAKVKLAQTKFLTLPAEVRARFDNDPGKLWSYAQTVTPEALDLELSQLSIPEPPPPEPPKEA